MSADTLPMIADTLHVPMFAYILPLIVDILPFIAYIAIFARQGFSWLAKMVYSVPNDC